MNLKKDSTSHIKFLITFIVCFFGFVLLTTNAVNANSGFPAVTFTASTNNINPGDSVTLNWSSPAAITCTPTFSSNTSTFGSETVNPMTTTVYAVTCSTFSFGGGACGAYSNDEAQCVANGCLFISNIECGGGSLGNATCSSCTGMGSDLHTETITINVLAAPPNLAPIGNINFGPRTIGAGTGYYDEPITIVNNGGTDTIINVTGFSASSPYECFGPGCTNHTLSAGGGNVTVNIRYTPVAPAGPEAQETISVTCTGGCAQETFTVNGEAVTAVPPPPTAYFSSPNAQFADQNVTIIDGNPVNLTWTSGGGASSCEITATNLSTGTVTDFWSLLPTGGTLLPAPTPSVDTRYSVECVNAGGTSLNSPDVIVTVNPPAPTVTFEASVEGGPWSSADLTGPSAIEVGEDVQFRWSSTNAVSGCTGLNFNTSGVANNMAGVDITEPTGGNSTTYTITCTGSTNPPAIESITIDTNAQPNLTGSAVVNDLVAQMDGLGNVTGNYESVEIIVPIQESNGVGTGSDFDVLIEIDVNDDGTVDAQHTFLNQGPLPANGSVNLTRIFTGLAVPVNPQSRVRVEIDPDNRVEESDENNTYETTFPNSLPPFTMELTLDPSDLVRGGGDVDITYDTNAIFDMECTLSGPALTPTVIFNPMNDGPTDTVTAGPIISKSQYTLECVEQITDTYQRFSASASVETTGFVEEI